MTTSQAQIFYEGRVQGVGFRFTTRMIAQKHQIVGYVKNLSDGRVELVAKADKDSLEAFLSEIRDRFKNQITKVDIAQIEQNQTDFTAFEIRR